MSSLGTYLPTNAKQTFCHCHGSLNHSSGAFLRAGSVHSFTRCLVLSTGIQMTQQPWTLPPGACLLTSDTPHLWLNAYHVLDTELSTFLFLSCNLHHSFQEVGFSYHHLTHEESEAQKW